MKYIVVHSHTHNLGKFVLATNDMSLNGEQALTLYKGQSRNDKKIFER
jgi:hypothetical protein